MHEPCKAGLQGHAPRGCKSHSTSALESQPVMPLTAAEIGAWEGLFQQRHGDKKRPTLAASGCENVAPDARQNRLYCAGARRCRNGTAVCEAT